jgi:hypothetical protein
VVPADEIDIGVQEGNISNHQPVCGSSSLWDVKSGVEPAIHSLMKGCMSAYYMQLRLDSLYWFTFLSGVAFRSLRDLKVGYWVNQRDPNGRVSFGSNFTQVVHCTSYRRPASSTVFCEIFMNLPPTNGLLRGFRNVDGEHIEGGNVLLIKHPLRDVHRIENMTHADVTYAGKLLQWCAKRGDLWQLLTTILLPGHCVRSRIGFEFPTSTLRS